MNAPIRPMPTSPRNEFERLFGLGYAHVLPIVPPHAVISPRSSLLKRPNDRGKVPGVCGNAGWHSFDWMNHHTTETDLARWAAMDAGVGLRCGEQPDGTWLALIDADTLHTTHAGRIAAEVGKRFPGAPQRIGRAPKSGWVIRLSEMMLYTRCDFDDGMEPGKLARVEILTSGRQFVAAGIHPVTREPYRWPVPLVPYQDLPIYREADVMAFLFAIREFLPTGSYVVTEGSTNEVDQKLLRGDPAMVRKAVAALPNTSALFPTRESYLAVGYAIKAAVPGEREAREIWSEWCGRWDGGDNDPERDDAEWRRMKPPFRRGAPWLFDLAHDHSGGAFDRAMIWHEPVPEVVGEPPLFADAPAETALDVEPIDLFSFAAPTLLSDPPPGCLPELVERWARSEARRKGVSMAFAAASAVGVLGAAIGSSLVIRPRLHDTGWTEPAALWVALVAGPGYGKSPIISAATRPLRALDAERFRIDNEAHKRWVAAEAAHKKRKDAPDPGLEPAIRRSVVDDATLEKQVRIHADNPRGLLRATDELLSLLASLGAYKKNAMGDRSQMLRLFEGEPIIVDRVGSGSIRAERALMGLVAGTQPKMIRTLADDLGQDGMLQRFVFIMSDGVMREGLDEAPDRRALEAYEAVVRYLGTAEHGADGRVLEQTAEARRVLEQGLGRIKLLRDLPGASEAWEGHIEKWPKLLHRIALIFHAVEHFEAAGGILHGVPLDAATARRAVAFGRFLLRHSWKFYETYFGQSASIGDARAIAGYLLVRPDLRSVTRRDVYEGHRTLRKDDKLPALLSAMRELENCGWVEPFGQDREGPRRWQINPRIHEAFAAHAAREKTERTAKQARIMAAKKVHEDEPEG